MCASVFVPLYVCLCVCVKRQSCPPFKSDYYYLEIFLNAHYSGITCKYTEVILILKKTNACHCPHKDRVSIPCHYSYSGNKSSHGCEGPFQGVQAEKLCKTMWSSHPVRGVLQ